MPGLRGTTRGDAYVVTLVEKLQKSEKNLLTRTEMYESAMKKVEEMSLRKVEQSSMRVGQSNRRGMREALLGKADVQIVAHKKLVSAAKKEKEDASRASRRDSMTEEPTTSSQLDVI